MNLPRQMIKMEPPLIKQKNESSKSLEREKLMIIPNDVQAYYQGVTSHSIVQPSNIQSLKSPDIILPMTAERAYLTSKHNDTKRSSNYTSAKKI